MTEERKARAKEVKVSEDFIPDDASMFGGKYQNKRLRQMKRCVKQSRADVEYK